MHKPQRAVKKGEFLGTMGQLERLARKYKGTVRWMPTFRGTSVTELYVDNDGTVYTKNPDSGFFSILVGQCELLPEGVR